MRFGQLESIAAETVAAVVRRLPADIRTAAQAVTVHFEAGPDETVLAEGFEPDILGLFQGSPHGSEFGESDLRPPRIVLYLPSLWDFAEEEVKTYKAEVKRTYLHELGHFLGWDEDQIAARDLD
jgi:predicted Zn-dependent protease with MMP-like domain